jgi:hypothetical protein
VGGEGRGGGTREGGKETQSEEMNATEWGYCELCVCVCAGACVRQKKRILGANLNVLNFIPQFLNDLQNQ